MLIIIENIDPDIDIEIEEKRVALENLLIAYRERNHIVIIPRKVIIALRKNSLLSIDAMRTLEEIHENSREYKVLISDLSVITQVTFSNANQLENINVEGQNRILISYDYFTKTIRTQPTTLISENDTDHDMYEIMARSYLKRNAKVKLNIVLQKHCGYGSHTYKVYSEYKNTSKFAFCILDNDKKYPGCKLGSTAGQFKLADFDVSNTVEAKLLGVRELESLIPMETLSELIVSGDYPSHFIDYLDKVNELCVTSNGLFRSYFDHKEGISLKEALKPAARPFWKPFFAHEKKISIKNCFKTDECNDCGSCIKIQGFGDKILDSSVEQLKNTNVRNMVNTLPDVFVEEWDTIGNKLVSWGCAPGSRRARA